MWPIIRSHLGMVGREKKEGKRAGLLLRVPLYDFLLFKKMLLLYIEFNTHMVTLKGQFETWR